MMMNTEISIARGLAELKLLHGRIERAISGANLISSYKKSAKKINNIDTPAEFSEKAEASYQSINDLIERRKKIKSAIVASNAITMIKIADKEMTVANAIERKESISYEMSLLAHMENQYRNSLANCQRANDMVQIKLDELLLTTLGKEGKQKATTDEVEAISKPYLEQNQHEILDVLKLGDKIKDLKESIEKFNSEVDFVLSESNVITKIEFEG